MKQLINFINEKLKINSNSKINNTNLEDICEKIKNSINNDKYRLVTIVLIIGQIINNDETIEFLINSGYSTFNCHGNINDIIDDIKGLMPFSIKRKHESQCTTLFYGNKKINRTNYLPFQSSYDRFKFKSIKVENDEIVINLNK
jgi:hypothetical protein